MIDERDGGVDVGVRIVVEQRQIDGGSDRQQRCSREDVPMIRLVEGVHVSLGTRKIDGAGVRSSDSQKTARRHQPA